MPNTFAKDAADLETVIVGFIDAYGLDRLLDGLVGAIQTRAMTDVQKRRRFAQHSVQAAFLVTSYVAAIKDRT